MSKRVFIKRKKGTFPTGVGYRYRNSRRFTSLGDKRVRRLVRNKRISSKQYRQVRKTLPFYNL